MRIWLDPAKLYKYSLTHHAMLPPPSSRKTSSCPSGELGVAYRPCKWPGTQRDHHRPVLSADARGLRQHSAEGVSRAGQGFVLLRDVAKDRDRRRSQYSPTAKYNGQPASAIAVSLAAGANALSDCRRRSRPRSRAGLQANLPSQVWSRTTPTTPLPFVLLSVEEVIKTLDHRGRARLPYHVFVFLQNFRATLIPTIAVPVVLLATCGVLAGGGLFAQLSHPVRHGARHWPAGRRRHRCGRECRARHGGG